MRVLLAAIGNPHASQRIIHVAGTKGKGSTATMIASILTAAGIRTGLFTSPHLDRVEERFTVDGRQCDRGQFTRLVRRLRAVALEMDRHGDVTPGATILQPGRLDESFGNATPVLSSSSRREPTRFESASAPGISPAHRGPTYFELTTALGLAHFAECETGATVLEVGMGGRLDSTNVCRPVVSVITTISYDHTQQLGRTLAEIAREKAGIIKPGVPVVSGVTQPEPRDVIARIAEQNRSPLIQLGEQFDFEYRPARAAQQWNIEKDDGPGPPQGYVSFSYRHDDGRRVALEAPLALLGRHQAANAAVALAVVECLSEPGCLPGQATSNSKPGCLPCQATSNSDLGCLPGEATSNSEQSWSIPKEAIVTGLRSTRCPARIEVVRRKPTVLIDAAHNVASTGALVETIAESFPSQRRILIFAATLEKDVAGMMRLLLPQFEVVYLTRYSDNPRCVPPEELEQIASGLPKPAGQTLRIAETPEAAWRGATSAARAEDLICVTGSFFIAAQVRTMVGGKSRVGR
jgi:dihydrofolate synthase/folylpolyglutamate synthase